MGRLREESYKCQQELLGLQKESRLECKKMHLWSGLIAHWQTLIRQSVMTPIIQ